jgi:serine protease Do
MPKSRSLSNRRLPVAAGSLVLLVSLAGCERATDAPASTPAPAAVPVAMPSAGLPDFAGLVARVGPAVVNISSVTPGTAVAGPAEEDGPFGDFFQRFGMPRTHYQTPHLGVEGSWLIV